LCGARAESSPSNRLRARPIAAHPGVRKPRRWAIRSRRGTPPSVVETNAETWLALVTGRLAWADAVADGALHASGERCDLSVYLPLLRA